MHIGLLVLFILLRLIGYVYNDDKNGKTRKQLEYIVNDRKIPCTFERYYFDRLHMPTPAPQIDMAVINRYYSLRLIGDKLDRQALNDVEAAQKFFNDRIGYLSCLN